MATPRKGMGCGTLFLVLITLEIAIGAIAGAAAAGGAVAGWSVTMAEIAGLVFVVRRRRARDRAAAELAAAEQERHREALIAYYGEATYQRLLDGRPWQGATAEMIEFMFGRPEAVTSKVHKARTVETWKYRPTGRNRYAFKVELENGVCVGWEDS